MWLASQVWGFYVVLVVVDGRFVLALGVYLGKGLLGHRSMEQEGWIEITYGTQSHIQPIYVIGEEMKIRRGGFLYPGSHNMLVSELRQELRVPAQGQQVSAWHQLWTLPIGILMKAEESTSCSLGPLQACNAPSLGLWIFASSRGPCGERE